MLLPPQRVFKLFESARLLYDTIRSAQPQCVAGMHSISDTDSPATLAE